jgi:hypothetical protein
MLVDRRLEALTLIKFNKILLTMSTILYHWLRLRIITRLSGYVKVKEKFYTKSKSNFLSITYPESLVMILSQ